MSGFEDERIDLKTFLPVHYESKRLLRSLQSLSKIAADNLHKQKVLSQIDENICMVQGHLRNLVLYDTRG